MVFFTLFGLLANLYLYLINPPMMYGQE